MIFGKPNEWVVVINNGEMKQAGIGLTLTKGPYDQVAIFPSKVNKVSFSCQQITKEMQGLEVSAMIVWQIFREGDGPMKAYKNLGQDLISDVPVTANSLINSAVVSIVRNHIANSSIDDVIKNRDALKNLIMETLRPLMTGWGIWLETVEITDVKILSQSVFRDIQCKFREDQNQKATDHKMEVEHEITTKKSQVKFDQAQRDQGILEQQKIEESSRNIVRKSQELQKFKKDQVAA